MRIEHIIQTIAAALCIAMLVWMLQSCKTPQPIVQEKIVEVEKIVTNTDTIVTTRPDSASIKALLVCDSLGNVLIKELAEEQGKNVALELQLYSANKSDNKPQQVVTAIEVDCKADSLQLLVDKYRAELLDKRAEKVTETIEVKYIPNVVKWFSWVGAFFVVFYLAKIGLWVYRKFVLKV